MDFILGGVILCAIPWAPEGWMTCDGQLLPIQQYAALFSLLGTTYGGDGTTHFALPKLAAPLAGMHYLIATVGIYPQRP